MKKSRKRKNKISAKTAVLILALICLICIVGVILLTCSNESISSDEALDIVLEDLGITEQEAGSPHIHEGTYQNQACYNVYITANGKSLTYVVSTTGEILHKSEGEHSH